jgi:CRISPR system Cascade subunit CasC
MKHLELHILQSVPVSCLNRDDLNSPKTAVFGGVPRARVSSQCFKRAIRENIKEIEPTLFQGERTRLIYKPLFDALQGQGLSKNESEDGAKAIVDYLVILDEKSKEQNKSKTLYFMSPFEIKTIAQKFKETKDAKKSCKAINAETLTDAADISLFGRMVAKDSSLNVEGAASFSHALSTHKVDNEIDFFSAGDDLKNSDESGAGMIGTLEFNSAVYYRFATLNLSMLADKDHLGSISLESRQKVVRAFAESTIMAFPSARKNTMNGNTLPVYVMGVIRDKGHPIQLINAFENAIKSNSGYVPESISRLQSEYATNRRAFNLDEDRVLILHDIGLRSFLNEVSLHVV